ncbi:hypothetical protein BH10CYA1_BH10CYA1_08670 [soil metagenome]
MKTVLKQFTKVLCVGLISVGSLPANAIVRLGDLGPLEIKFFAHQYDRETPVERLNRLEKLIFGSVQPGSIETRVAKISQTIDVSTPEKPGAASSNKEHLTGIPAKPFESRNQLELSTANYPRVSELERSLLGRTYVGEPVRQRLSRLETKAYGAPSRVDDLAVRVDKLSSYAGVYGMQPGETGMTSESLHGLAGFDSAPQTRSSRSSGMLERVSAMELKVFGHADSSRALVRRIKDLESSVLGSTAVNPNEDMTTRVNQLWASVKPVEAQPSGRSAQIPQTATLQPFSSPSYIGQSASSYSAAPYNAAPFIANNAASNNQYGSTQSKHKNKGQHSSFLSKIGKVVAFAGTAAVGAGGLAVGAMGSMNTGYYSMGMGTGYGSLYPSSYRSYTPTYGSVSSIGSFGSMSTGSMFGSPFNSSYAGSFFSP